MKRLNDVMISALQGAWRNRKEHRRQAVLNSSLEIGASGRTRTDISLITNLGHYRLCYLGEMSATPHRSTDAMNVRLVAGSGIITPEPLGAGVGVATGSGGSELNPESGTEFHRLAHVTGPTRTSQYAPGSCQTYTDLCRFRRAIGIDAPVLDGDHSGGRDRFSTGAMREGSRAIELE